MKKYFAETFGTFVLVFGGCGTAVLAGHSVGFLGVSIAFGLTVVAMAYGIGHISGAHLNPAVSIGALCAGKLKAKEFGGYVVAQVIGGLLAAAFLAFLVKSYGGALGTFAANGWGEEFASLNGANYHAVSAGGAFAIEFVLTFIFIIVILGSTSPKAPAGFGGLAIGLTLVLIHLISIPLTNTSVNPARSIGPALISGEALALKQLWLFIAAPLAGGALGGLFWSRMCGCGCKNGACEVK